MPMLATAGAGLSSLKESDGRVAVTGSSAPAAAWRIASVLVIRLWGAKRSSTRQNASGKAGWVILAISELVSSAFTPSLPPESASRALYSGASSRVISRELRTGPTVSDSWQAKMAEKRVTSPSAIAS
jgi:hypothetical protein